jgi:hypothetical protein
LKEGLRQALLANAALVAIVGSRITSSFAPQNTPAGATWLVISQISGLEDSAMDGNSNLTRPRFQLTVGGADQEQVDAVRDSLSGLDIDALSPRQALDLLYELKGLAGGE